MTPLNYYVEAVYNPRTDTTYEEVGFTNERPGLYRDEHDRNKGRVVMLPETVKTAAAGRLLTPDTLIEIAKAAIKQHKGGRSGNHRL